MARPCEADNFVGLVPCRPDGRFRVFGGQFDETVFCYNTSQPKSAVQRRKHLAKSQEIPEHGHDFLKTSLETLFHNRKNAKSKCQFRRLDLSGFAAMGC